MTRLDGVGLALAASALVWFWYAGSSFGGDPAPAITLLAGCSAAYAIARIVASRVPQIVPGAIVFIAGFVLASDFDDVVTSDALRGPFSYSNAKAAFFVQATIAALLLYTVARGLVLRIIALGAALTFALVTVTIGSRGATLLVLILPPIAAVASGRRRSRLVTGALGTAFVMALVGTTMLGAFHSSDQPESLTQIVEASFTERRAALWGDALAIIEDHPISGVGSGRFDVVSPVARSDRDARWAHQGFLQQGAETGVLGGVLLVAIFLWMFVRLMSYEDPGRAVALGAAAVTALGIHVSVDYLLHFGALPILTAAIAGAALVHDARRQIVKDQHEGME